jgi:RND family efflux transporter MFP subunit
MKKPLSLLTGLLLLFALQGCKDKVAPGIAEVQRPVISGVTVEAVQVAAIPQYYETSGSTSAGTTSVVASRLMAAVTKVTVKEGDRVQKGDLLITLDDNDIRQKLQAAEAAHQEALQAQAAARENMALAATTHQRYKNLFEGKAVTRQEFDQVTAAAKVAVLEYQRLEATAARTAAGLDEIKVLRSFAAITAPTDGIITNKKVEPGNMAVPGMPLLTVADTSSMEIRTAVEERYAGRISPGMEAAVQIPALDRQMTCWIKEVVAAVDPGSRTFPVRITLDETEVPPGLYAKIRVTAGERPGLLVPAKALVYKGQLSGVYAVDGNNIVTYRLVRTGRQINDRIEILAGLAENDLILTSGVDKAVDGGLLQRN